MTSAEIIRLLSSLVLVGEVAELDEEGAHVRVDADGMRTDWIPWGERRAGAGVRTWCPPEVGEQVVMVCPYGDPSQGVIVASIYQDAYAAPANAKTIHRTTYADGTVIEYDRATHALKVDVGSGSVTINCATASVVASESVTVECESASVTASDDVAVECASATVTASESVTLDTPETVATGNLTVEGDIIVEGNANVEGDASAANVTASGEVTAGNIGLTSHHHMVSGPSGPTSPAQA